MLEQKQKELKAHDKLVKSLKLKDEEIQSRLRDIIESYYNVIGLELDAKLSSSELKKIAMKLPDISNSIYGDSNLKGKIQVKSEGREIFRVQLTEAQELLALLETNSVLTQNHAAQLRFLEMTSSLESDNKSLVCPVCHTINTALSDEILAIHHSKEELKSELAKIDVYKEDNSQQIEELRKRRNSQKRQIAKISSEIDALEKQDKDFQNKKSLRDQAFLAKGMAEANIKNLLSRDGQNALSTDVDELKERITWLKSKLEGFDLKSKIKDAEVFLSKKMTDICNQLDFEDELKPGVLRFSIEDFVFYYHFKETEKIYLSAMGSGANWLACHLSLFIALLHLNCREKKSTIPSFLFIDQPSQVYFPTKYGEAEEGSEEKTDENIMQVRNIFRVIIEALIDIEGECGFLPQIVVMEHADENEFDKYVKARWKKDGIKLV